MRGEAVAALLEALARLLDKLAPPLLAWLAGRRGAMLEQERDAMAEQVQIADEYKEVRDALNAVPDAAVLERLRRDWQRHE